jgi:ABC-type proline/glycine betaine transport system substrate-binding protein|tara:strand:- start:68 stop:505 length:438 start_codon:yes stop_codon:yes gene_type:complete
MDRLQEAIGLGLILGALHGTVANAVPVVPNFTQGSMTSHTETTSTVTETINSMDYNTGYQYSASGSGVTVNGTLSPGTGTNNVTIDGVTSSWTGVTSKPQFTQTNIGEPFQFTETYMGPGLSNQTIIQRTTEVKSITDTTSIFQQ